MIQLTNPHHVTHTHEDNAPRHVIVKDSTCTCTVTMDMKPLHQFDQGGLVVYFDTDHWLKTVGGGGGREGGGWNERA